MGNRLTVWLLMLVVVLGGLLGWQLHVGARNQAPLAVAPTPVMPAPASDRPPMMSVPPLEELTETLERPLFVRSRRPPPVDVVVATEVTAEVPQEPALTALTIKLSAVVMDTERQYALFVHTASNRLLKVEPGQEIEGWVLREIRADGVRLERGAQSQNLPLRTFESPPPAARARGKAARRAKATDDPRVSSAPTARRPRRPRRGARQRPVVRQ